MEPISRTEQRALVTLIVAAVLLAAWVLIAPAPSGVDGRTFLALVLAAPAMWMLRPRRVASPTGTARAGGLEPPAGHRGRW